MLFPQRVPLREVATYFRQLEVLFAAGVPLGSALTLLAQSSWTPRFREVTQHMRDGILGGASPARECARFPEAFSSEVVGLLSVGESTGEMQRALERLSTILEKTYAQRQKLVHVTTYPLIVLLLAMLLLLGMMVAILPRLVEMIQGLSLTLPTWFTATLTIFSWLLNPWVVIVGLEVAAIATYQSYRWSHQSPRGKRWLAFFLLNCPILGRVFRTHFTLRVCWVLGETLECGGTLLHALDLTAGTVGNVLYQEALEMVQKQIQQGRILSQAFADCGLFPRVLVQLLATGEEASTVPVVLKGAQYILEAELEETIDNASSLLEPMIMMFLGGVVGGVVLFCFLPLTQIASQL